MKRVIRDYFFAFRIHNIKERYGGNNFANWYPLVYPLILMPIIMSGKLSTEPVAYIQHYGVTLIFLYSLFAAPLHPVVLPKLLYLCPMDASERRTFVRQAYVFKIGIGVAVSILGTVLLVIFTGLSIAYGAVFVLSTTAAIICSANMDGRNVQKCAETQRSAYIYSRKDGWEIVALVISMVSGYLMILGAQWQEDFSNMGGILITAILVAIELPFVVMTLKRSRQIIDAAVNYER